MSYACTAALCIIRYALELTRGAATLAIQTHVNLGHL